MYAGAIPEDLEAGVSAAPFPVEVLNSTGAGDAFLAGFLLGWIRREDWETCCRFGNACGAMVVSRHACSAAMPSLRELNYFLSSTQRPLRLWEDKKLEQLHWATRRKRDWPQLEILAFDHRTNLKKWHSALAVMTRTSAQPKVSSVKPGNPSPQDRKQVGAIIDEQYGGELLEQLTGSGRWLARPIEQAGVTPLEFVGGPNVGLTLKALAAGACRQMPGPLRFGMWSRDSSGSGCPLTASYFMPAAAWLESCCWKCFPPLAVIPLEFEIAAVMRHLYDIGLFPDWWKIECPPRDAEWDDLSEVISDRDPECRGVILLGKGVPLDELRESFRSRPQTQSLQGICGGPLHLSGPHRSLVQGCIAATRNVLE